MTTDVKGIVAKNLAVLNATNTFAQPQIFSAGITLGTGSVIDPLIIIDQNLVQTNFGWYSNYSSSLNQIIYGFASNVRRTGGTNFTVGGQFSGYAQNSSVSSGGTWGIVTQAVNIPGATTNLVASESGACNMTSNLTIAKVGVNAVFKNRFDGDSAVSGGVISSNSWNARSIGFWVTSQPRSTVGEYCGFRYGLKFDENSLDRDIEGTAIGIDFASVKYLGVPDPLLGYNMTAAIRLRDFQSILWNGDPTLSGNPTDPASPIRTYFDSVETQFRFTNTGVPVLKLNMANGDMVLKSGSKLFLDGSTNQANIQYDVVNSRFAFDNAGTHQLSVDVANGALYMRHGAKLCFEGSSAGAYLEADPAHPGALGLVNAIFVPGQSISFLGANTNTSVGSAGTADALPAQPSNYVQIYIDGVQFQFPVYNI